MIELNETMIMPMNGICILLVIFLMIQGYVRGGLRSVLSCIGTVISFYESWLLAEKLSAAIPLIQNTNESVFLQEMMNQAYAFANRVVWFVICFLVCKVILLLLDFILKRIQHVPVYHFLSCLSGVLFGVIESGIWIILLCVVLESPLFLHGNEIVHASFLGSVLNVGNQISEKWMEPVFQTEQWNTMISQASDMTDEQIEGIKKWLEENPVQGENDGN